MKPLSQKHLTVYLYNDLPLVTNSQNKSLLSYLLRGIEKNPNVIITNIDNQIEKLAKSQKKVILFDTTISIGDSGERVAKLINSKTGIFPNIVTFKIARHEVSNGKYTIPKEALRKVSQYFEKNKFLTVSIVDDTLYSGLTLDSVIKHIPKALRNNLNVFLLQGLSNSVRNFQKAYKVFTALEIDGIPEKDVTIIKASGLFTKGAIRLKDSSSLAFFEREEWMREWFPENWKHIIEISKKLERLNK